MPAQTLAASSSSPSTPPPPPPPPPPQPPRREVMAEQLYKYLSGGFCEECDQLLKDRIAELASAGYFDGFRMPDAGNPQSASIFHSANDSLNPSTPNKKSLCSPDSHRDLSNSSGSSSQASSDSDFVIRRGHAPNYPSPPRASQTVSEWPVEEGADGEVPPPAVGVGVDDDNFVEGAKASNGHGLSMEERERIRFSLVGRKKDFVLHEKFKGRMVNVLEGLELHTQVFSAKEQKKIVDCVYSLQKLGREGKLRERTYSQPKKWMPGKGRATIQFGCCYNYAVDKNGNPPGIIRDEEVDPFPPLFKLMIKRMVRWHVLPPSCIPNSCIVNLYDEGDCIPPHIDHHDFVRPFCTVSFLSESSISFGLNLKIVGEGKFSGPAAIPLPVGSVLILNGNGADVAKHCVSGVHAKRISITFRKMDDSKLPYRFSPDPDLQNIQPLPYLPNRFPVQQVQERNPLHISHGRQVPKPNHEKNQSSTSQSEVVENTLDSRFKLVEDDFPALGGSGSTNRSSTRRNRWIRQ